MSDAVEFTASSGNVFADLGFDEPEMELVKADLAHQISRIVARHGWSQRRVAQVIGIDQPKVSKILRGRLGDFSAERLMQYITKLNHDVDISVVPNHSEERAARIRVRSRLDADAVAAVHVLEIRTPAPSDQAWQPIPFRPSEKPLPWSARAQGDAPLLDSGAEVGGGAKPIMFSDWLSSRPADVTKHG